MVRRIAGAHYAVRLQFCSINEKLVIVFSFDVVVSLVLVVSTLVLVVSTLVLVVSTLVFVVPTLDLVVSTFDLVDPLVLKQITQSRAVRRNHVFVVIQKGRIRLKREPTMHNLVIVANNHAAGCCRLKCCCDKKKTHDEKHDVFCTFKLRIYLTQAPTQHFGCHLGS